MFFPSPASTTPEQIADALVAANWLVIADPTAATGESLAVALEAAGYYDFPDPTTVTPEDLAWRLNSDTSLGGISNALKHWRNH